MRTGRDPVIDRSSDALHSAVDIAHAPSIERALQAIREFLDMDIAYASEHLDGHQHIRLIEGDSTPSGTDPGYSMPLADSYCKLILEGRLPNMIPDTGANPLTAALPVTAEADVGAFCSVPLRFSDGRLYGTLCAESSARREHFGPRDLEFMHVFARMISDQLEHRALLSRMHVLELENATATAILAAVASRDAYTASHSHAVVERALVVARELGLGAEATQEVRQVALLHDIGKLAIPDAILLKPGPLTCDELAVMRTHPIESERIVARLPGPSASEPGRACRARAFRREGLPRRARRRDDPAREPHHARLRRLPRDGLRPAVPRRDHARAGAPGDHRRLRRPVLPDGRASAARDVAGVGWAGGSFPAAERRGRDSNPRGNLSDCLAAFKAATLDRSVTPPSNSREAKSSFAKRHSATTARGSGPVPRRARGSHSR